LEAYAVQFDPLLKTPAQRHGFRTYLSGLLLPRERSKTLTALVGAEPLVQAQAAEVQRLQFFLSEAAWDAEAINARRLALLAAEPATAPSATGVLVIDDTGDRKDGSATDHVARQYLGSVGKIDNGIVAVTTLWADEAHYYPLHAAPYTPAVRLAEGKHDAAFHTKPQIALDLVERAQAAGIPFSAIVADCFYGDDRALEKALLDRRLPHVLARRGAVGRGRAPAEADHSFADAARSLLLRAWQPVVRRFRDGHAERWWAAELTLFGYGPGRPVRAICATTDLRHDRSARVAGLVDLVPHHQLVARTGTAGRGRAAVRTAQLGPAKLQTDEGRARLGRLHGPKRPGDPAPLDAGVLRVCLLLVARCRPKPPQRLVHPTGGYADNATRGGGKTSSAKALPCWPRLLRCSAP
jgi:hypothetical protein